MQPETSSTHPEGWVKFPAFAVRRRDNVNRFPVRLFLSLLAICLPIAAAAAEAPAITWASDPVRPNETVMLMGGGLKRQSPNWAGSRTPHRLERLTAAERTADRWQSIVPLQSSPLCSKFVVPPDWKPGIYACRFRSGEAVSNTILLNAPDPWWMLGDQGETATPGGWLRIFGKCLSLDKERPLPFSCVPPAGAVCP